MTKDKSGIKFWHFSPKLAAGLTIDLTRAINETKNMPILCATKGMARHASVGIHWQKKYHRKINAVAIKLASAICQSNKTSKELTENDWNEITDILSRHNADDYAGKNDNDVPSDNLIEFLMVGGDYAVEYAPLAIGQLKMNKLLKF